MLQPIHAEFSIAAAMEDQQNQKRKREFHRQSSQTEEEPIEPSHKRTTSRSGTNYNANIFRVAADTLHDEECREDPVDEHDHEELNSTLNSYRGQSDVQFQCVQEASSRPLDDEEDEDLTTLVHAYRRQHEGQTLVVTPTEPLDLPLSPKEQRCDYMMFSPVSSFFHPAILRATTICESASDILCGQDPPEVDSRPTSPHVYQEAHHEPDAATSSRRTSLGDTVIAEEKEREAPSWLNAPSTFNWSIPKSNAVSSPWTGVFQLGSSWVKMTPWWLHHIMLCKSRLKTPRV